MPAPANDNFANRLSMTGESGHIGPIDASGATEEVGEPNQPFFLQTTWYTFTPAVDGRITLDFTASVLDTANAGFPPQLDMFTGTVLVTLVDLINDIEFGDDGVISLDVTSGTAYHTQVGTAGPYGIVQIEFTYEFLSYTPRGVCIAFDHEQALQIDPRPVYVRLD